MAAPKQFFKKIKGKIFQQAYHFAVNWKIGLSNESTSELYTTKLFLYEYLQTYFNHINQSQLLDKVLKSFLSIRF